MALPTSGTTNFPRRQMIVSATTLGGTTISNGPSPDTPNWGKELIQAIAMDIGKDVVAYIEVMYPEAIKATSSTFKLSVRNSIYNEIIAAIQVSDEGKVIARLKERKKFRRWWTAAYRKIRNPK